MSHPSGEQQSCLQQGLAEHGFNFALAGAMNKVFEEGQMEHADLAVLLSAERLATSQGIETPS